MEKSEIIQIIKEELKLLERELTDKELKRRDKIADELPDAEFKKRYGKDYKSVKYATATKMAKREENDPEDGKAAPHGSGYNVVKEYNIQALRSLRKVVNEGKRIKPFDLGYRMNLRRARAEFNRGENIAAVSKSGKGSFKIDNVGDFPKYPPKDWDYAFIVKEGKVNEAKFYATYNKGRGQGKAVVTSKESDFTKPRVFKNYDDAMKYVKFANRSPGMTSYWVSDIDMNRIDKSGRLTEDYSQRARNFRVALRRRLEKMKPGQVIRYGKLFWTAQGKNNFRDSLRNKTFPNGRMTPGQDVVQALKQLVKPNILQHRGASGDDMVNAYLKFEGKVNEAAMYKKGQKVQYQIDRGSSNALKPSTGTISKIQKKGNSYVYTVQDGGPVPVHELEIIALTEAFKKGDKVKYLDQPGVITNVEDKMGKTYYSVKYKGPNGTRKAKGVLSTDGSLTEAVDINDPVLVAIRAMKTQMKKKTPVKKIKKVSFDQYLKLIGIQEDLVEDMKDTAEDIQDLFRNMEQEAEPSGGPIADKYGAQLDKLEKQYAALKKKKAVVDKKIENYRMS